jgi:hypothetical protein
MLNKVAFTMHPVTDMPRARAFLRCARPRPQRRNQPWVEFDSPAAAAWRSPPLPRTSRAPAPAGPSPSRLRTFRP